MATTEIVFVRHGQTRSNLEKLLHGRTDEPLNSMGRWQAQQVAERINTIGRMSLVHSSPLSRARVTAQTIAKRIGADTRFHEDLAEFYFGEFEGYTLSGIQTSHPEIYRRMFDFADLDFRFPNGESRREFHARVFHAVNDIVAAHTGERFAIVAHEGVIVSAVMQMTGGDPSDWTKFRLGNCSITRLESNGSRIADITSWNDTMHLDGKGEIT